MRRLLLLVSVLVLVDTMLYAALTPMLPRFARELHLSKAGAGTLVAAYAAGALLAGLPAGRAAVRFGPRRAVLGGLALMCLASLGFAVADSYPALLIARICQGTASALTWAGSFAWLLEAAGERRGELIGKAMGAAVVGSLLGPVVGSAAEVAGRATIFSALAAVALVLALATLRHEPPAPIAGSRTTLARAIRHPRLAGGLAIMAIASLLFGGLDVLAPLRLGEAGWGAVAIGAVWLLSAGLEASESPVVGRLSDRLSATVPIRYGLLASLLVSLALATDPGALLYAGLVVLAGVAFGALFTPSFTLISEGAELARLPQGIAFGMMNGAWAAGAMIGPAAGGAIASATGDSVPFLLAAAICAGGLVAMRAGARSGLSRSTALGPHPAGERPLR
jgi:MFS family permease